MSIKYQSLSRQSGDVSMETEKLDEYILSLNTMYFVLDS